jgi:hypothetical protein
MASQPPKTSQAGSLSASFSEKLKVAGAKAARGDHKASSSQSVNSCGLAGDGPACASPVVACAVLL